MLVIWGQCSFTEFHGPGYDFANAVVRNGGKIVVIDPRRLRVTKMAEMWLKPRPNSDPALAMGLLKIIIGEELYDKKFVKDQTTGFDKLKEEVAKFSREDIERVTWIPLKDIEQLARWYGEFKSTTLLGRGNTWSQGSRNFQGMRLMEILRSIVDPNNIPNWGYSITPPPQTSAGQMYLLDKIGRPIEKNLGKDHKYGVRSGYIPYQDMVNGILDDKVKAVIAVQCDPIITFPNSKKVYEAFMKLELSVVANIFMVPTACIADIVLPVATTNECDTIACFTGSQPFRAIPKLVEPPGEARSDVMIINTLAKRLGLGKYFFDSDIETMNYAIQPSGITYEQFKKVRMFHPTKVRKEGNFFTTPSGKLEIYSQRAVQAYGCEPIPTWKHVTNFPQPTEEFPLLLTSHCDEEYKLSGYKHVHYFRKRKPYPTVQLNPEVCEKIGAKDGDWVWIETRTGKIMQKLVVDPELDPRVVMTTFGWYFPENPENANQWDKANINILFPDEAEEIATGSLDLRGYPCRVYKAQPSEVGLKPLDYLPGVKV